MNQFLLPLLLLLAGTTLRAENFTNNGKVYYDAAIVTSRCNAASITFTHKAGIAKLDFLELSEANRVRFGYDSARYQAFKDEELRLQQQAPPQAAIPAPAPVEPLPASENKVRVVQHIVVVTNSTPHFTTPFGASPESTIRPDNDKMNDIRLRAMKKAMGINSRGNQ